MKISNSDSNIFIRKEIGNRIKRIRVLKKLTQKDLADKTGLSLRSITRIENGESTTSFDNVLNILRYFNMLENIELLITEQLNEKSRYRKNNKVEDSGFNWGEDK